MKEFPSVRSPIRAWVDHVAVEAQALSQLQNVASLPIVEGSIAVMPDVHWGIGATVGSVIPTRTALIPAAVGVDIGCGMAAVRTTLTANDLPDSLKSLRAQIERDVPVGFRNHRDETPDGKAAWLELERGYQQIIGKYPTIKQRNINPVTQIGTLGGGNHFIEVCLDESGRVWIMLHSGSRGIGNRIGMQFIGEAKKQPHMSEGLPDKNLAWLDQGSELFDDYWFALQWAQRYAMENRKAMMATVINALRKDLPPFELDGKVVQCHHNYAAKEFHGGVEMFITRKGAVSAREGELGIIPGSMGARSYIVRGRGNPLSYCSCSHGAGRVMSRTEARKTFSVAAHVKATEGVECRKDARVIDETPMAYKDIDAVMASQSDLVEAVHTLKQVICVKG
jgi:tRNA-splicing ligase RtcB